jgi:hypothetical protein
MVERRQTSPAELGEQPDRSCLGDTRVYADGPLNDRLRQRRQAVKSQLDALQGPLRVDFRVNTDRLRTFRGEMGTWMRQGDPVRRKTLLRNVYQEIRLWPKSGGKSWTRKVFVSASLEVLTRSFAVSPRGFVSETSRTDSRPRFGR